MNKTIFIIMILLLGVYFLTGCAKIQETTIQEKIDSEIRYFSVELIEMLNNLNNLSLNKFQLNIENLKENIEKTETNSSEEDNEDQSQKDSESQMKSSNRNPEEGGEKLESKEQETKGNDKQSEKYEIKESNYLLSEHETLWEKIKVKIEKFTEVASEVILDLREVGVNEQDIEDFQKDIDNTIISIKKEEKITTAENLEKLYSKLSIFLDSYSSDNLLKKVEKIKNSIIKAYVNVEKQDWEEAQNNIKEAVSYIDETKQISEQEKKNEYNIKKIELQLNEIENSIASKDKDVFYIRYINVIQELQSI